MSETKSSFDDLEKQLAKDALEKALKNLHGEISSEIERNKNGFSEEIRKTLSHFKKSLETSVSEEIDKKLTSLFENNFYAISADVKSSYEKAFSPVLENTKKDMKRLHTQGEATLTSWQEMMGQYKALWTRPFFIMFSASILTGLLISFLSSYYLTRSIRETMKTHENLLLSYKKTAIFYLDKVRETENKGKEKNKIKKRKAFIRLFLKHTL